MKAEFLAEIHAENIADGSQVDRFQLTSPFMFTSAVLNDVVEVPAGFIFDGESAPWPLKRFGFTRRAGCGHDWLYKNAGYWKQGEPDPDKAFVAVTREQADAVYLELAVLAGCPVWRASVRHTGLRLFGWKAWNDHRGRDALNRTLSI